MFDPNNEPPNGPVPNRPDDLDVDAGKGVKLLAELLGLRSLLLEDLGNALENLPEIMRESRKPIRIARLDRNLLSTAGAGPSLAYVELLRTLARRGLGILSP